MMMIYTCFDNNEYAVRLHMFCFFQLSFSGFLNEFLYRFPHFRAYLLSVIKAIVKHTKKD